jgi:hypothetical protein
MLLDVAMELDIEISEDGMLVARIMSFTTTIQNFKAYFNCHSKAHSIQAQINAAKPYLVSKASEMFEAGVNLDVIMPEWLRGVTEIDV